MNDSWIFLSGMAFVLGVRHGFDLDHLATIDAIARTVKDDRNLARLAGILFSLGHGLVVTFISLVIGSGLVQSHIPQWLDSFGNWVSIVFLFVFGLLNLWSVLINPSTLMPVGLKSFLSGKLLQKGCNPRFIILIGALFAFSFDTFSQVALFSISASLVSGWVFAGVLGLFFMLGMMASDGLNGLFVSAIIQRADRGSLFISHGVGLGISVFSLTIGCINLIRQFQ